MYIFKDVLCLFQGAPPRWWLLERSLKQYFGVGKPVIDEDSARYVGLTTVAARKCLRSCWFCYKK